MMPLENKIGSAIYNSFGDQYFHSINGTAFNKISAEALYKKHFGETLLQENGLYIILGTDSGLLPKYLQKIGVPDETRYIFVEIPRVLEQFKEVLPEEGFDHRIILTTPEEWATRAQEVDIQSYIILERTAFFRSIGAEDLHMTDYRACDQKVQDDLKQLIWTTRGKLSTVSFHIRQLENLAENRVSASCLKNSFKGKTAIILGGGPSLDSALPWIAENREDLAVIAVSRIARRLMEVELIPDIWVSVDPQQISFDVSKEMLLLWRHSIFVHQYHVVGKLPGQWQGRNVFLGPRFGWSTPWNTDQMTGRGPTVTNMAIDVAIEMGFSRLLLAGVDLCFSKEGFTHAQGSNERQIGPQLARGVLWVETNSGGFAETSPDLNFAIKVIAAQAGRAQKNNCRVYNLGKNSARIPGIEFIASEDLVLDPLTEPPRETLENIVPQETTATRKAFLEEMDMELNRASIAFKEIKRLSEKAIRANDTFFGRLGKAKGHPKSRKEMDHIEKKLNTDFSDFTPMLKEFGIKNFIRVAHGTRDQSLGEEAVDRLMGQYYETYRDSATRILELLHSARDRLSSRIEEEKAPPDYNRIINQWEIDDQPGRVLVWKTRHMGLDVPTEIIRKYEALEKKFDAEIQNTETVHMKTTKANSTLGPVRGKLKLMFKRGERDHLKHMIDSLQVLTGQEAKVLFHLGSGFLAELTGSTDAALTEYQQIINALFSEQGDPVLEAALLRIFSISLDRFDTDNALLTAKCLSDISSAYLPYYAEILCLTGNKIDALDVYAKYLETAPGDISAMLKLGQLYRELNVKEGVKLMSESVLKNDPGNETALELLSSLEEKRWE